MDQQKRVRIIAIGIIAVGVTISGYALTMRTDLFLLLVRNILLSIGIITVIIGIMIGQEQHTRPLTQLRAIWIPVSIIVVFSILYAYRGFTGFRLINIIYRNSVILVAGVLGVPLGAGLKQGTPKYTWTFTISSSIIILSSITIAYFPEGGMTLLSYGISVGQYLALLAPSIVLGFYLTKKEILNEN